MSMTGVAIATAGFCRFDGPGKADDDALEWVSIHRNGALDD
ncbi:hypothetical protein JOE11_003761 [Robbsia andropogonis]